MIIDNKPQHLVEMSHDMETTTFAIEQSAKAFVVLSSKLYKDKAKSIVRELSCNARDAHVDAGTVNIPFDVHLPSPMEPEFWIRDYGTGLSDEHIKTVYTRYFKSTKENNQDAVGCLGLGSKSPFAYTQSFMVTSWFRGTKTIYSVFINERSEPAMAKMFEMVTDEPNGIEVRFNVPNQDQNQFETACADVYRWFDKVRPNFVGRTCSSSGFVQTKLSTLAITKRDSHSRFGTTHASVIMAGVEYPINTNNPEVKKLKNVISFLSAIQAGWSMNVTISAFVDMGAIDFTPSREELEYTKKTLDAVNQAFVNVKAELQTILPELKENDFSNITFAQAVEKINKFHVLRKQVSQNTGIIESAFQQDLEIDTILNKKFNVLEEVKPYIVRIIDKAKAYKANQKLGHIIDIGVKSGYANLSDKTVFVVQDVTGIDYADFVKIYPEQEPVFVFERATKAVSSGAIVKDSSAKEVFENLGFKCILASTLLDFKLKDRKYSSIYLCNFGTSSSGSKVTTLSFSTAKNKDFLEKCTVPVFYMELANKRPVVDEYYAKMLLQLAEISGFKCKIIGVYMPTKVDLKGVKNFEECFAKELDFWMQSSIKRNVFVHSEIKRVNSLMSKIRHSCFKENISWAARQAGHGESLEQYDKIEKLQNEIARSRIFGISYNGPEFWNNMDLKKYFPLSMNKAVNICNFDIKQLELQCRVHECLFNIRQLTSISLPNKTAVFDEMVKAVYNFISFNKT